MFSIFLISLHSLKPTSSLISLLIIWWAKRFILLLSKYRGTCNPNKWNAFWNAFDFFFESSSSTHYKHWASENDQVFCLFHCSESKHFFLTIRCRLSWISNLWLNLRRFHKMHLDLIYLYTKYANNRQPYCYIIQVRHVKLTRTYLTDWLFLTQ